MASELSNDGGSSLPSTVPTVPDASVDQKNPAPVAEVPAALASKFAVFRRDRQASDVLAVDYATAPTDRGQNLRLSRRVASLEGQDFFAVPSEKGICLLTAGGSGTCSDNADTLIMTDLCAAAKPGDFRLETLFKDGIAGLTVTREGASPLPLKIVNNAVVIDLPASGPAPVLAWRDADGSKHEEQVALPPNAQAVRCG